MLYVYLVCIEYIFIFEIIQNRVLLLNIILSDNSHHSSTTPFFVTSVFAAIMVVSIFFHRVPRVSVQGMTLILASYNI